MITSVPSLRTTCRTAAASPRTIPDNAGAQINQAAGHAVIWGGTLGVRRDAQGARDGELSVPHRRGPVCAIDHTLTNEPTATACDTDLLRIVGLLDSRTERAAQQQEERGGSYVTSSRRPWTGSSIRSVDKNFGGSRSKHELFHLRIGRPFLHQSHGTQYETGKVGMGRIVRLDHRRLPAVAGIGFKLKHDRFGLQGLVSAIQISSLRSCHERNDEMPEM